VTADHHHERLYGLPHAEHLERDIATVYEGEIEPRWDPDDRPDSVTVEEWTVHPPIEHLPPVDTLLEWAADWASDNADLDTTGDEQLRDATQPPAVAAAFRHALAVWADHITYRMAKDHVATHTITWDPNGEPLVNGAPMYAARMDR
jgi:hypothetical protein